MIYKGRRVAKIRDWTISDESPHYVKDVDLQQVETSIRFPLHEVAYYATYGGDFEDNGRFFSPLKNSDLLEVYLVNKGTIYIIETLERFDSIIEQYDSSRMLFRQQ